jgi:hypothetical protein
MGRAGQVGRGRSAAPKPPVTKVELTEHSPPIKSSDEEVSPPTKAARAETHDGNGGLQTPIVSPGGDP